MLGAQRDFSFFTLLHVLTVQEPITCTVCRHLLVLLQALKKENKIEEQVNGVEGGQNVKHQRKEGSTVRLQPLRS